MARRRSPSPASGHPPEAPSASGSGSHAQDWGQGEDDGGAGDLSYNQAHAALELVLAELQATDLDVEAMAGLYRRGQAYAQRCEAILHQVEQDVLVWDGLNDPYAPPQPADPTLLPESPHTTTSSTVERHGLDA
ncbi:MAG: exodeoxyribonuclease VII small subunit [Cyanobium sp. PLM2.Bin73]|nr:MAG: exodeoxyribonuclease VII small subunit [Cyanobium sp. PLM2.Bin73]